MEIGNDLLSPLEAAKILRCGETVAYRTFKEPDFPIIRLDEKKIFVRRAALQSWIERQENGRGFVDLNVLTSRKPDSFKFICGEYSTGKIDGEAFIKSVRALVQSKAEWEKD